MSVSVKTGGYAQSASARPWMSEPVNKPTVKSRKQKNDPVVRSSILAEAAITEQDAYWSGMLKSASMGNLPKGFLLRSKSGDTNCTSSMITFKKGTKVWQFPIPECREEARQAFKEFFRGFGMGSPEEQVERPIEKEDLQPQTWKEVRSKKKLRDLLIDEFAFNQAEALSLSHDEKLRMLRVLRLGFALGYLDNSVVFEEDQIKEITGLTFDPNTRNFTFENDDGSVRTPGTKQKEYRDSVQNPDELSLEDSNSPRTRFRLLHPTHKGLVKTWEAYLGSFFFPTMEERNSMPEL